MLPAIVNCMTTEKTVKAKEFIEYLWKTLITEYDPDTQSMQLQAVKELIENVGLFLTQQEVHDLGERVINFLDSSLKKRGIMNESLKEQVSDEED